MALPSECTRLILLAALFVFVWSCGSAEDKPLARRATRAQAAGGDYIAWAEHVLDDQQSAGGVPLRGAVALRSGDLDNDGHTDLVAAYAESRHIRVAFGSATADGWFRLSLAEGEELGAVQDIALGDLNGDGFLDVVAVSSRGGLFYLQNPGGVVRDFIWQRVAPEAAQRDRPWTQVFIVDVNQDGRADVLTAGGDVVSEGQGNSSASVAWFELPDEPLTGSGWKRNHVAAPEIAFHLQPLDMDGDGDLDLWVNAAEASAAWLENLGGPLPEFVRREIVITASEDFPSEIALGASPTAFHDFNSDGLDDAALIVRNWLVWLERPAEPGAPWKLHPIGTMLPDVVAAFAIADINGDGAVDVMAGSRSSAAVDGTSQSPSDEPLARLAWFESPSSPAGPWLRHEIARAAQGVYGAFLAADLDRDSDLDFLAARASSGQLDGVFWLEQLRSSLALLNFEPANRKAPSIQLPLPSDSSSSRTVE